MVLLQRANREEPPDPFLTDDAEHEVVLAERLDGADPFVGWLHAVFLAETGHVSAAAAAAEAALARCEAASPLDRAPLLGVAGTYRYELGEERAALPLLERYVELRTDDAAACFRIGSCLLRIAAVPPVDPKSDEPRDAALRASRAFERCFELAPGDEDAGLAIGTALARAGELDGKQHRDTLRDQRWTEAAHRFTHMTELFPSSAEPWFRLGALEVLRRDPEAARAAFEQGRKRDAGHLGCLLELAALAEARKDPANANALLQRAIESDAKRPGLTTAERRRIAARLARA
jgi:tetratricopeptide (TPR) repeat protein